MGDDSDDDWAVLAAVAHTVINNNTAVMESDGKRIKMDHRRLSRGTQTRHNHDEAHHCMMRDCLGPHPKFKDKRFVMMFRISKSRFQRILEEIGNSGNPFF